MDNILVWVTKHLTVCNPWLVAQILDATSVCPSTDLGSCKPAPVLTVFSNLLKKAQGQNPALTNTM